MSFKKLRSIVEGLDATLALLHEDAEEPEVLDEKEDEDEDEDKSKKKSKKSDKEDCDEETEVDSDAEEVEPPAAEEVEEDELKAASSLEHFEDLGRLGREGAVAVFGKWMDTLPSRSVTESVNFELSEEVVPFFENYRRLTRNLYEDSGSDVIYKEDVELAVIMSVIAEAAGLELEQLLDLDEDISEVVESVALAELAPVLGMLARGALAAGRGMLAKGASKAGKMAVGVAKDKLRDPEFRQKMINKGMEMAKKRMDAKKKNGMSAESEEPSQFQSFIEAVKRAKGKLPKGNQDRNPSRGSHPTKGDKPR